MIISARQWIWGIWQSTIPGISDGAIKVRGGGGAGGGLVVQVLGTHQGFTLRTGPNTNRIPHPCHAETLDDPTKKKP